MNEWWSRGLWHYEMGNHYAARELWEKGLEMGAGPTDRVRYISGLVSAHYRLSGPERALDFSELAVELAEAPNVEVEWRMMCSAQMTEVLCTVDKPEQALRVARRTLSCVTTDLPLASVYVYQAYVHALMKAELYREAIRLEPECIRYVRLLQDPRAATLKASFLHAFGYAAQVLHEYDVAFAYYLEEASVHRSHEAVIDLCRAFLLLGHLERALDLADELHRLLWDFPDFSEKTQLSNCLVVIGTMAHFAHQTALSIRCFDKAELYFGQLSSWSEWVNLREWRESLQSRETANCTTHQDWRRWHAFLDDLNLLDGLELMFPNLFRMSRIATEIAKRVARAVLGDVDAVRRDLMVAGRLVYIGYTVMFADESQVLRAMRDEMVANMARAHGERLLQVYAHSAAYCEILRGEQRLHDPGVSSAHALAGQCLWLAVRYVENMALLRNTHAEALTSLLADVAPSFHPSVVEAFRALMAVGEAPATIG